MKLINDYKKIIYRLFDTIPFLEGLLNHTLNIVFYLTFLKDEILGNNLDYSDE